MFKKEPKEEKEPALEKEKLGEKIVEDLYKKKKEEIEKRELLTEREKIIREKLEREIAMMELSPELKEEAKKKVEQIEALDEKEKLKKLLDIAEEKGISFAIGVIKEMKDLYILDVFHDILAREEFYKKFKK